MLLYYIMSTDFQILMQKFHNFKTFVTQIAVNKEVIKEYNNMSDNEFLLFGLGFLLPNQGKLDLIVTQMCQKIGVNQPDDTDKLRRYLLCFIEYLSQINNNELLEKTILNVATEQQITIP